MEKLDDQRILASGLLYYKVEKDDMKAILLMLNSQNKVSKMLDFMRQNLRDDLTKEEIMDQAIQIAVKEK